MFKKVTFFCLLMISAVLHGQIVEPLGQAPPKLRWYQIRTAHFRILYPAGMETDAQRTINAMENAYSDVSKGLGVHPRAMPIVLQNQTTDNNAFVTSEGRRAEFFSTPPQNPNSQGLNNWIDELSLHEFRHVVQQDQTLQGWGKAMFWLFGNSGSSVVQGLTNPWWFWEGDAVGCESALGYGGRGRIPSFDLTFRATLLSRKPFSYIKASCGSTKNAIPNHYVLGYFMTTYVKNHNGADVWDRILNHTYKKPPLPFSFSHSMKKMTGLNAKQTYKAMTTELKELWGEQIKNVHETPVAYCNHAKTKFFTNYKYPQFISNGRIVAQKSGLAQGSFLAKSSVADQAEFVLLRNGHKEKKLNLSGVLDDNGMMSSYENKIVWTEYTYDPRWGARNYTVIKILDASTGKIKQLTHRTRLHAPCFSPDGKMISAIDFSNAGVYHLVLIDATTGETIKVFPNPENMQLLQPHFTSDGKNILMIRAEAGKKSIVKLNLDNEEITIMLPAVGENISAPLEYRKYIFYNSPQSGIDNIYALDTESRNQYRVTNRKFGAFNASISEDGSKIVFQDFTKDGFRIAETPFDTTKWEKITAEHSVKVEYFKSFARQEAGNILSHIPDSQYVATRYKKASHLVNIYSWGLQPLSNLPNISLGIRSQDLLSTTVLEAGFRYDNNEKHFGKYLKFSYMGLYPQFSFLYDDGIRNKIIPGKTTDTSANNFIYNEISYRDAGLGIALPLNFSSGKFITKLSLESKFFRTSIIGLIKLPTGHKFSHELFGHFHSLTYTGRFETRLRQNMQDVAPRLGGSLLLKFAHTPFRDIFNGSQTAVSAQIYLPGFSKHDAFKLKGSWQNDKAANYYFENSLPFVRGASNEYFNSFQLLSVDYKTPLFYCDLPVLNGAFYFQRVKADLFTELALGKNLMTSSSPATTTQYNSVGIELTSDVNFMRFLIPFDVGVRNSYLTQTRSIRTEVLFNFPLF
jgi:hypothetical protein